MPTKMLVKLLRRYSYRSFNHQEHIAFERDEHGVEHMATVHDCCEMAADELARRDVEALKFRALVDGMKKRGAEGLYELIMHEPIDKAVLK